MSKFPHRNEHVDLSFADLFPDPSRGANASNPEPDIALGFHDVASASLGHGFGPIGCFGLGIVCTRSFRVVRCRKLGGTISFL